MSYKKCLALLFIIPMFLLSSCISNQSETQKNANKIKQIYSNFKQFESNVKFICDSGQSILEYDCDFEYNDDKGQILTIKKPDVLKGIKIKSSGTTPENINISFEETVLDFNTLVPFGASPVNCMPMMISCITNLSPNDVWEETQNHKKLLVTRYELKNNDISLSYQIWFYKDNLSPMYAEIYTKGQRILQIFFNNFTAS